MHKYLEFLKNQYFLAQRYQEYDILESFAIFKMNDLDSPFHHFMMEDDYDCKIT
jgi:hypothetical protein